MIEIHDKENRIWRYPKFIRKFFLKNYYQQGFVYFYGNKPVDCSNVVKWLEKVYVETTNEKRANELMFKYFNEKYPQYKFYIQLF